MKNYTHHFDIDGLDVYANVAFHEGQEGSYANYTEPISPYHEIYAIWVGDQELNAGDLFEIIEARIQEELGTPI